MISKLSHKRRRGFSLLELLIVISVIGILLAIAAPNIFSLLNSQTLTGEGALIRNKLTLARQMSISKNADVEVRFFKVADTGNAAPQEEYRAYQFFMYDRTGVMAPVSEAIWIKPPVLIDEKLSTILSFAEDKGTYDQFPGVNGKTTAPYVSFRYRPDGSTDLPGRTGSGDTWYLSLVQSVVGGGQLPDNYFVVQVDSFTGRVSEFRP